MEVKKIDDTQITNAIDLIWQTFLQFEAPDYSEEGVKSFQEFIENKEIVASPVLKASPPSRRSQTPRA